MILSCKGLLELLWLTAGVFPILFLTHVMFNILMPGSVPATHIASIIAVTGFAMGIWKRQVTKKKIKSLDEEMAILDERLHNVENSLADVHLMNLGFDSTLKIVENQSKQFKLQMEDKQTEIKNIKEKLQSLEMTEEQDEDLQEKQRLFNVQWKLEKRIEELEKLQLDTDKGVQSTEAQRLVILTGRQHILENIRKKLKEKLDEKGKEKETLQRS